MKLFYASGASSLAVHILLEESGLDYSLEKVNLDTKKYKDQEYGLINPKAYVPALKTNYGVMTECAVILEYIAHLVTDKSFIETYGTQLFWEQKVWLNYIATELHKNFISPFRVGNWLPNTEESKNLVYKRVFPRLKYINDYLGSNHFLVNNQFSLVDPYLFVMTNWVRRLEFSFINLENLERFDMEMRKREAVKRVLKREGKAHSLDS
ncbi:glutathione S-transferase [Lactococcus hircilactis]|uniref:Glutathione S-transferase n=1 Tax=Lactococcus hircilactis TaxID=1494462 RepID=A0A7X1Z7D7_9LACT|nr:glutathione S-transferase N-terminal domain-containing protein [Lactococcus hircilactis]MQW38584.1 glutathione S-transferase [Lactococcus hircilactis]